MNTELQDKIRSVLSDINGELDPEDEDKIINSAYKRLYSKKNIDEEAIIDAIIEAFKEEEEENSDDEYYMYLNKENSDDELFNILMDSNYDAHIIRNALDGFDKFALSDYDMHRGSIGSYYDEKGKDYRPNKKKSRRKPHMEEFEIMDEGHKDIKYHNDVTKIKNVKRTRADMLAR